MLNHAQSELSEHVQILLNGSVYNTAEIFRVVNIQNPVHGFHRPFHPGMMEQLQRGKRAAGNIVVPFFRFYTFSLKFCLNSTNTAQILPLLPPIQPAYIRCGVCSPRFYPISAFSVVDVQSIVFSGSRLEHIPGFLPPKQADFLLHPANSRPCPG